MDKRPTTKKLPEETIASILVEWRFSRDDEGIAKRHGISTRTLRRYRELMLSDAALAALVKKKSEDVAEEIRDDLIALVRESAHTALELVQKARTAGKVEALHSVVGAMKIAKECLLEDSILNGPSANRRPNPPASAPAGGTGAGGRGSAGAGPAAGTDQHPIN